MPRRPRGRPPHDDLLTPAEWRVLHAVQHGLSNAAIAARLGVSVDAIKFHVRNIGQKTGIASKRGLRHWFRIPKGTTLVQHPETHAMPATTFGRIGQIARTVGDIDLARSWYELVLELPHLYTFGKLSFFDCDGTRLMLSQEGELNPRESILYFNVADIAAACDRLRQKGVEFIAAPHMIHRHADGTQEWMAFFKDPDGRPLAMMAQVQAPS